MIRPGREFSPRSLEAREAGRRSCNHEKHEGIQVGRARRARRSQMVLFHHKENPSENVPFNGKFSNLKFQI